MFKKKYYSKKTLSTFEIIGSFVVDLYYNHFYAEAKRFKTEGRVESTTDGYKHAIKAYIRSFNNPEQYRKSILGIHKYYITTTRFSTISFTECVNEIVGHFIPEDFFETTTNKQRDGILRTVLVNAVKQFSSDVLCSNILDSIIDKHDDVAVVRTMQNKMVQALMYEREKLFQNIFNVANKPSANKDITIVMKMKKELINLVKQNHDLINKYNGLKTKALKLIEMVKELKEENERLQEPNNGDLERSEYTHDVKLFNHRQNAQNAPQHIPNVSHHMSNVPQHMPTVFNHATPQTVNEQHGDQVNITETEQHYDNYIQKENDSSDMDNKTLVIPNTSNYNDRMITPPESTQYIHSDHQNSPVSPGGVITLNPAELIIASNESEHPVANEQPVVAQQPENAIVQTSDVISPDNVSFFQGVDIN